MTEPIPPSAFASRLARLESLVGRLEQFVLFVLLIAIVTLGAGGYLYHLVTKQSIPHGDVLIRYAVFAMAMVGGAFAAGQGRLLSMDALSHVVSPRGFALLRALTAAFAIAMTGLLMQSAWRLFERLQKEATHGIPMWVPALFLPLGLALLLFHLLLQFLVAADAVRTGRSLPRGEP